jgi:hypothetical protein
MPEVDPAVVDAFKKVKKDTSMDWNTLSIKLDASGEVNPCCWHVCCASLTLLLQIAQIDAQYPNMRPEQLAEELPETAPRFLVMSFKYPKPDGRVQYPLCLIYYCPETCADRNRMMYTRFVNVISKALDITTGQCSSVRETLRSIEISLPRWTCSQQSALSPFLHFSFAVRELRDVEGLSEAWLQVSVASPPICHYLLPFCQCAICIRARPLR